MRTTQLVYLIAVFIGLCACNPKIEISPYEPRLVVEGQIEEGGYASVFLSYSMGLAENTDQANLMNHIIAEAKVTVSNGTDEEVLLLRRNNNRIPPYEYITTSMKGEVGKIYKLKVIYKNRIVEAETTIPKPVAIDSIWFVRDGINKRGYIHITFPNKSTEFYRISTRIVGAEHIYIPALYGNLDSHFFTPNQPISQQVNRGAVIFPKTNISPYFPDSCLVDVKLSTQNSASYQFWKSYQNELLNGQNILYPTTKPLKSNIKGGIGIWCGLGSTTKRINLNKYKQY